MISSTFIALVEELKIESASLERSYGTSANEVQNNFIDIEKFVKVLYTLFDINGLLLNSQREDGVDTGVKINQEISPTRFYFTEEYPDQSTKDRDTISYEIVKRAPAALGKDKEPFQGTKQYRAMYRGVVDNKIKGCKEVHMMKSMDNLLRFTCWSTKVSQAHRMAKFLEQFLAKYNWFLRRFVPVLIFVGQNKESQARDDYGPLRYYPIHLDYFIRTDEMYTLSENEVKTIEVNMNSVKTIINLDN